MNTNTYQPGVCNIGPEEIKMRNRSGYLGLAVAIILGIFLLVSNAQPILRLIIFIPLFSAAIGFLQAKLHFCAGFGMRGVYNVLHSRGEVDNVLEAENRKIDRIKAIKISLGAVVIAAVGTVVFYLI